jgi:hypothetical protein
LTLERYWIAAGTGRAQRIVVSLGTCSCNVGAPAAVVVGSTADVHRIMALLVIAMFVAVADSFVAAEWFGRRSVLGETLACSTITSSPALRAFID